MGSSGGNHGARAISRHLKVLLPWSLDKLRISDELSRHLDGGGGAGAGATALLVSPFGGKVWRVEVGRDGDGDGAFLGRGWPEYVRAHGVGAGWFVVLRHEGGGVLTVKAFDTTCCLKRFNVASSQSSRPQFIKVLLRGFTEKMVIPPEFVRNHISEPGTNSRLIAVLLSPRRDFWRVEVEKDWSGNLFLAGGWSEFLASRGITQGDAVLLRCEGGMAFTVKAFGPDGRQKVPRDQHDIRTIHGLKQSDGIKMRSELEAPSSSISIGKGKSRNEGASVAGKKRPRIPGTPSSNKKAAAAAVSTYDIGPPSWAKKEMSASALKHPSFPPVFCRAIGLVSCCEMTLALAPDGGGATRSWPVHCCVNRRSSPRFGRGWVSFCRDNELREGDVCTFNVVDAVLWRVRIARRG